MYHCVSCISCISCIMIYICKFHKVINTFSTFITFLIFLMQHSTSLTILVRNIKEHQEIITGIFSKTITNETGDIYRLDLNSTEFNYTNFSNLQYALFVSTVWIHNHNSTIIKIIVNHKAIIIEVIINHNSTIIKVTVNHNSTIIKVIA